MMVVLVLLVVKVKVSGTNKCSSSSKVMPNRKIHKGCKNCKHVILTELNFVLLERAGIKLENKGDLTFFYEEQLNQVRYNRRLCRNLVSTVRYERSVTYSSSYLCHYCAALYCIILLTLQAVTGAMVVKFTKRILFKVQKGSRNNKV